MLKKKEFISAIESFDGFKNPAIMLEQYTTDAVSVADFIYFIGIDYHDIIGNIIIDLGAGTGRLGLAATLFGSTGLVAIEKDTQALAILRDNIKKINVSGAVFIINEDIERIILENKNIDRIIATINEKIQDFQNPYLPRDVKKLNIIPQKICIMNPPFGIHKRGADRSFLQLAMAISDRIYSIHLSGEKNRAYIRRFVEKTGHQKGWKVDSIHSQVLFIKGTYIFHKKSQKKVLTDVYRIIPEKRK
ncbi:MAG: METTL5 family protein [Promethearchaeota archaeon]